MAAQTGAPAPFDETAIDARQPQETRLGGSDTVVRIRRWRAPDAQEPHGARPQHGEAMELALDQCLRRARARASEALTLANCVQAIRLPWAA